MTTATISFICGMSVMMPQRVALGRAGAVGRGVSSIWYMMACRLSPFGAGQPARLQKPRGVAGQVPVGDDPPRRRPALGPVLAVGEGLFPGLRHRRDVGGVRPAVVSSD